MTLVLRKCREASVLAFIFANDVEFAKSLIEAGWDVVAIGTDMSWFLTAAAEARRNVPE
jgi:2-keto-3-deoxy-L-rhamnonate aldolase RhmA